MQVDKYLSYSGGWNCLLLMKEPTSLVFPHNTQTTTQYTTILLLTIDNSITTPKVMVTVKQKRSGITVIY